MQTITMKKLFTLVAIAIVTLANAQLTFGQGCNKVYVNPNGINSTQILQDIRFKPGPRGTTLMCVNVGNGKLAFRREIKLGKEIPMTKEDSIQAKKQYDYYMKNNIYARP